MLTLRLQESKWPFETYNRVLPNKNWISQTEFGFQFWQGKRVLTEFPNGAYCYWLQLYTLQV
jgi:hypothetical protein